MPLDLRQHANAAVRATAAWAPRGSDEGLPVYDEHGRVGGLVAQDVRATGDADLDASLAHPVFLARVQEMRDAAVVAAADPDRALADWVDHVVGLPAEAVPVIVLVEAVAAAVRLESAARARTAALAAELARRPEMEPRWNLLAGPVPAQRSVAADELAIRLGTSRISANRLVSQGLAFDAHLQATGDALACGRLDAAKAWLLVQRLGDLPGQVGMAVEDRVLPGAGQRSLAELRVDVERALREVDPEAAAERHVHARTTRQVSRPRPEADGMASLWVVLAAEDAARIDGVLEHAAQALRALGDPRTTAQARADGLRDLVVGDVAAGPGGVPSSHAPVPSARGCSCGGSGRPGAQVRVTIAASTLLGADDQPGELEGHGPIDAVQARALAEDGVWRRVVTDPASGTVLDVGRTRYRPPAGLAEHVRVRDRHCAAPGCTVPARRCDIDHTVEYRRQPGEPPRGVDTLGTTSAGNLGLLCRRHHRLKTDGGFRLRQVSPGVYEWITPGGHRYLTRPGTDDVADVTTAPQDEPAPF